MSHIETGSTKLSLPVLVKVANALSCGTDELLSDNLENCRPIINREVAALLDGCDAATRRVLVDILRATKGSIERNL
jgi:hypothetical protein